MVADYELICVPTNPEQGDNNANEIIGCLDSNTIIMNNIYDPLGGHAGSWGINTDVRCMLTVKVHLVLACGKSNSKTWYYLDHFPLSIEPQGHRMHIKTCC